MALTVPRAPHHLRSLLAYGGSDSGVFFVELNFLKQPMKQAQMKTTKTILGRWSQDRSTHEPWEVPAERHDHRFPPKARMSCTVGPPLIQLPHLKSKSPFDPVSWC